MKTYQQHFNEFRSYLNGMTNNQVRNIFEAEQKRHQEFPDDECYHACYDAANLEMEKRGLSA